MGFHIHKDKHQAHNTAAFIVVEKEIVWIIDVATPEDVCMEDKEWALSSISNSYCCPRGTVHFRIYFKMYLSASFGLPSLFREAAGQLEAVAPPSFPLLPVMAPAFTMHKNCCGHPYTFGFILFIKSGMNFIWPLRYHCEPL